MCEMKVLKNELELSDSKAIIFDSHCTPSHPEIKIVSDFKGFSPILSFEDLKELYEWVVEKIKTESWCGCETIAKIQEEDET